MSKPADAMKWLWREAILPAAEKLIPQGSQEITNALFTGNAYWPGGETQQAVPMSEQDLGTLSPSPTPHEPYAQQLCQEVAGRSRDDDSRGIDR